MTMPSTDPLPVDEGTHKIVVTVAGDSEDDRIKGLLLMATRMTDKALRAPSHNDFVLDAIGVVRHLNKATFCLMGGETARTRGIIFWDVATMYHSIYFKWGKKAAHEFRDHVQSLLQGEMKHLFTEYFADVRALHYLNLLDDFIPHKDAEYVDDLLDH